jgi:hypothetical protein
MLPAETERVMHIRKHFGFINAMGFLEFLRTSYDQF